MNTYQIVVIALLVSVIGGAVYFATSQGAAQTAYNLVSQDAPREISIDGSSVRQHKKTIIDSVVAFFKGGDTSERTVDPLIGQMISGTYMCSPEQIEAGCDGDVTLKLYTKGKAEMVLVYRDGAETEEQFGTWGLNDVGQVEVTLSSSAQADYKEPRVLMFNREDDGTLSLAQFMREEYPSIRVGIFSRATN